MMSECNFSKGWLISAIAVFLFTMGFDWYVHGHMLMDMYKQTASVWRPEGEMQALSHWCFIRHAIVAALLAGAYGCWRDNQSMGKVGSEKCPYKKSMLGFGLWVGLLLGVTEAGSYVYLPIPAKLAQMWFAAELIKGLGIGIVLNFVHIKFCTTTKKKK